MKTLKYIPENTDKEEIFRTIFAIYSQEKDSGREESECPKESVGIVLHIETEVVGQYWVEEGLKHCKVPVDHKESRHQTKKGLYYGQGKQTSVYIHVIYSGREREGEILQLTGS